MRVLKKLNILLMCAVMLFFAVGCKKPGDNSGEKTYQDGELQVISHHYINMFDRTKTVDIPEQTGLELMHKNSKHKYYYEFGGKIENFVLTGVDDTKLILGGEYTKAQPLVVFNLNMPKSKGATGSGYMSKMVVCENDEIREIGGIPKLENFCDLSFIVDQKTGYARMVLIINMNVLINCVNQMQELMNDRGVSGKPVARLIISANSDSDKNPEYTYYLSVSNSLLA